MEVAERLTAMEDSNPIQNGIIGLVVGDALGVPVEFKSRKELSLSPIIDMIGYGTYNQPAGTWSDDSSLTLCLADELTRGFNIQEIGNSFVKWYDENHWTPHGEVFDIGNSTKKAINRLRGGEKAELAGSLDANSNGNGSLMRILPLMFELKDIKEERERFEVIKKVSSITHGHLRSCLACYYYLEFASFINHSNHCQINAAYDFANNSLKRLTQGTEMNPDELAYFDRLMSGKMATLSLNEVHSSGHVIDTLEASIWCLLTTNSYKNAVLKAVNLGEDTDTTGAVTGGLAGLFYGVSTIPQEWISKLASKNDITDLINRLSDKYDIAR